MEFLLKAAFYGVFGLALLAFCGLVVAAPMLNSRPSTSGAELVVLFLSGLTALGFLGWAGYAGHMQGEWAMGLLLTILAIVLFVLMMVGGILLCTKSHWQ